MSVSATLRPLCGCSLLLGCATPTPNTTCTTVQAAIPADLDTLGARGGVGPERGTLLLEGGDLRNSDAGDRFRALCGGADAKVVFVVTGMAESDLDTYDAVLSMYRDVFGFSDPTVLHTRSTFEANTEAFVAPLRAADCVFFSGGRQWRYVDAYLHTAVHDALFELLDRGGTIGGTSAGSSVQASFLVRGDTLGNDQLIGDHTEGFGFLDGVAVDQHIQQRMREDDLSELVACAPELLGIGIDEHTWIEVTGDTFEVQGAGHVYVHNAQAWPAGTTAEAGLYEVFGAGETYDMAERVALD